MKTDNKYLYKVYTENGMNFVLLPNGTRMPMLQKTILEDDSSSSFSTITITVQCHIYSTKEEAELSIKQSE